MAWLKFIVAATLFAIANGSVLAQDDVTIIPETAGFTIGDLEGDKVELVGSLGMRRLFLGTRAEIPHKDLLEFYSFTGQQLKFARFADPEVEKRFLAKLAGGYRIPVVVSATIESKRVGHDGINMSTRKIPTITKCEPTTFEAIGFAAKAKGIDKVEVDEFKSSLEPDAVVNDIAVTLGRIYIGSKTTRRDSRVSISQLRIFNPTENLAKIEIKDVTVVQNGISQTVETTDPNTWVLEPNSWADGIYEKGKSPKVLWNFYPEKEITTKEKATVTLHLTINGEAVSLEKTPVAPHNAP